MSTPVATVADALIAFIMSLLRDPAAVEEFDAAPKATLASKGLDDACAADVQAVKPVIVDHPSVVMKPAASAPPPPPPHEKPDAVIKEIKSIVHQFTTVDARTTIVDQSTNQNIWTNGGDVTQIFDQEAVVASGDHAIAAGDDATFVDSEVDVTVGDVSVGNTTNEDSFNNTGGTVAAEGDVPAAGDEAAESDAAVAVGDAVQGAIDSALDAGAQAVEAVPALPPEPVSEVAADLPPEPVSEVAADPLTSDLTSTAETYESEDAGMVVEEAYVEEPTEEQ